MSLTIQITTHASEEEVRAQLDDALAIATALDEGRAEDDDRPASTVKVWGNDFTKPTERDADGRAIPPAVAFKYPEE